MWAWVCTHFHSHVFSGSIFFTDHSSGKAFPQRCVRALPSAGWTQHCPEEWAQAGAGSPQGRLFFVPCLPPRERSLCLGQQQPALGKELRWQHPHSRSQCQSSQPEMHAVTPIPYVSQCSVFQSWFIEFWGFFFVMPKRNALPVHFSAVQAHGITYKTSRLCTGIRHSPFPSQEEKTSLCYVLCWSFARSRPPLTQDKHSKQLRYFYEMR